LLSPKTPFVPFSAPVANIRLFECRQFKGDLTMMRKWILAALAFMFVIAAVGTAASMDQGNKRKGKYVYRKVYATCFARGACASETPPLSPNHKTQAEWEQVFDSRDFAQFGCAQEWGQLSGTDLTDIFTYLYAHASDSPTPLSCK